MRKHLLLTWAIGATGIALLAWNSSRFHGAEQRPRSKALDFLPSPTAARILSLGQDNAVAKLRWIDSFAYFQLQLQRRNDTVGNQGQSGFARLYDMLIGLDPRFPTYYEHASLNLGGILGRDLEVQRVLNQGLLSLPHQTQIWRMLASELSARSKMEEHNPHLMDALLNSWAESEETNEGKQLVWDWKRAMAIRTSLGLDQIAYWEEQLHSAPRGSPARTFIVDTIRELLARGGAESLEKLRHHWEKTRFSPLLLIESLADPTVVSSCYPGGIPPLAPIHLIDGRLVVACDPFGYPYRLENGTIRSLGLEVFRCQKLAAGYSAELENAARSLGHWPTSLDEANAAGINLVVPPPGITWALRGHTIEAEAPPPPFPAWEPLK